MRELKFRKWSNGEPVYFDLTNYCKEGDYLEIECFMFAEGPIEQYTGEKDKNGVDIYEGDIIHYIHITVPFSRITEITGKVIWDAVELQWAVSEDAIYELWDLTDQYEVIGNIHENPELLHGF